VAAARSGAETILMERYGHLGGLATGGLVTLLMPMSDGTEKILIRGLCMEMVDRLDSIDAAVHPRYEDLGSDDEDIVNKWQGFPFIIVDERIRLSVLFDAEMMKCVLNDMAEESSVSLSLHSWASKAIVDEDGVKGVIFESKSGREAILAKCVIDASGDGDIFASAGAEFNDKLDPNQRASKLAFVFQVSGIDMNRLTNFKKTDQKQFTELMEELQDLGGFSMHIKTNREDTVWFNNFLSDLNGIDVEDLTWVEVNGRKKMRITYDFFKRNIPGFEKSYIAQTAFQVGVRSSRRLAGEHIVTKEDCLSGTKFIDTIAVCPSFRFTVSEEHPHMNIPYRALVPKKVDNLLVAGRCLSTDQVANDFLAPIQFCIAMGQAAGTASALALEHNIKVRDVNSIDLQKRLKEQGVYLG
ncbi:FAD-dependent oxidoreductase, partial [Thermodesulfobacteriota bacterium]